jgi:outer membrane protein TolC
VGPKGPPAVLPPVAEQVIELETALRETGVANPTIALAEEAVRASLAQQLQAEALLLPTLNAGTSFDSHWGNLESSRGIFFDVNRSSLYAGTGAAAVGAGTVTIPGVWVSALLAEAWFEPRAARQQVAGRRFDALATRNNILLEVVIRYMNLAGAQASLLSLRQSEGELGEIARVTAEYAKTGQGRKGDADRARASLLLLRTQDERAQGDVAVAAAELARLLDRDPAIRLQAPPGPLPLVELVNVNESLENLVQIALRNRPEVRARAADIALSATLLREEKARPFLPYVSIGYSAGTFGGGSNLVSPRFGNFDGRAEVDVIAVWTAENLGLGNLASQRRRRAQVLEAEAQRTRIVDRVRREVAQAQADAMLRRQELDLAKNRVRMAQEAYQEDLLRTRNLKGLPIEVLDSLNLLAAARQDLVQALVGYNLAQFQLYVAVGEPL